MRHILTILLWLMFWAVLGLVAYDMLAWVTGSKPFYIIH